MNFCNWAQLPTLMHEKYFTELTGHSLYLDNRYLIFACRIHPAAQSAIGKQQWVTGFHCVCEVLIVYQLGILSLSCSQYSQTIC